MRRILAILASVSAAAAVTMAGAGPAGAHSCATPSLVTVGRPASLAVGVAAESVAVDRVAIRVPPQFRLESAADAAGWTTVKGDGLIEFTGGRIEPLGCSYFTLRGTPLKRGTYVLPLKLHFEDGTERTFAGSELGSLDSGHVVFAGSSPDDAAEGVPDKSTNVGQVLFVAAFAVVGVVVAVIAVRRALRP